jgi:hypothetical protein
MTSSEQWTDGNALAGHLHDLIGPDVAVAVGRCGNCGRTGPMAEVRVFDHAPGVVARCPVCDQVLLRLVRGPGRAWLDLRGRHFWSAPATPLMVIVPAWPRFVGRARRRRRRG